MLVHEASVVVLLNSVFFQQAHSWPVRELYNSPAPYVVSRLTSKAIPVEFNNCNDSIMRVAGELQVPSKHSRDILLEAKGIILVKSTQMVLEMIRRGRLVR